MNEECTFLISFKLYTNLMRWKPWLFAFGQWGNWGSDVLGAAPQPYGVEGGLEQGPACLSRPYSKTYALLPSGCCDGFHMIIIYACVCLSFLNCKSSKVQDRDSFVILFPGSLVATQNVLGRIRLGLHGLVKTRVRTLAPYFLKYDTVTSVCVSLRQWLMILSLLEHIKTRLHSVSSALLPSKLAWGAWFLGSSHVSLQQIRFNLLTPICVMFRHLARRQENGLPAPVCSRQTARLQG